MAILSSSSPHDAPTATGVVDLEEWCMAVLYAKSRGSLQFHSLTHTAGAEEALC
jgi:hypothetical protein